MIPYVAVLPMVVEPTTEGGYSLHGSLSLYAHQSWRIIEVLDSIEEGAGYLQGSVLCSGEEGFRAHNAAP